MKRSNSASSRSTRLPSRTGVSLPSRMSFLTVHFEIPRSPAASSTLFNALIVFISFLVFTPFTPIKTKRASRFALDALQLGIRRTLEHPTHWSLPNEWPSLIHTPPSYPNLGGRNEPNSELSPYQPTAGFLLVLRTLDGERLEKDSRVMIFFIYVYRLGVTLILR